MNGPFDQHGYRARLDWGRRGAREAALRRDVVVIVDVMSFSTTVATAARYGAFVYPCAEDDDAGAIARRVDGEVAVHRSEVPERGRFSLSPLTFVDAEAGARVVVPSPNGATCARLARDAPYVFAAAIVNAAAVAKAVRGILRETERAVTVIACGERWHAPSEEGALRFAIEDYLGAGAVLSKLGHPLSPEAQACARAFDACAGDLTNMLLECGSGRELRARGYETEVLFDAHLDGIDVAPELRGDRFAPFTTA